MLERPWAQMQVGFLSRDENDCLYAEISRKVMMSAHKEILSACELILVHLNPLLEIGPPVMTAKHSFHVTLNGRLLAAQ